MTIIVLAAGRGERLMPLTRNTPKPLLDMGNGNTLLEEQLQAVRASGVVDDVVLVIGYLADQVEAKMRTYHERGYRIRTVFNPFWHVSNNLMSLWLARSVIADDDVLITNGDNLFAPEVFRDFVAAAGDGIWLSVSPLAEDIGADDMKVTLRDGVVARVSKEIARPEASAESPGLALVRGARARTVFLEHLDAMARDPQYIGRFWLEVFNRLWHKGVTVHPWAFDATGKWQEVDFHGDVDRVRRFVSDTARRLHTGACP